MIEVHEDVVLLEFLVFLHRFAADVVGRDAQSERLVRTEAPADIDALLERFAAVVGEVYIRIVLGLRPLRLEVDRAADRIGDVRPVDAEIGSRDYGSVFNPVVGQVARTHRTGNAVDVHGITVLLEAANRHGMNALARRRTHGRDERECVHHAALRCGKCLNRFLADGCDTEGQFQGILLS